jgi:pullulanase-type alpha-1,6-glucosidase
VLGGLLAVSVPWAALAHHTPEPTRVTVVGDFQSELGCAGDNDPACEATGLTYDASDRVWQGTFTVPAGTWRFRVALNGSASETHGGPQNADLVFTQAAAGQVKFYYEHASHYVQSTRTGFVAVSPGSFQSELGCPGDWQPDCLRSMLKDTDGDGIYTFSTSALPAGAYECKVALNESWDVNYGQNGVPGGANIGFSVPTNNAAVNFAWDSESRELTVVVDGELAGNIQLARAHWVSQDTLAWDPARPVPEGSSFQLHFDAAGGLTLTPAGVEGGESVALTRDPAGLSAAQRERFPHLAGFLALKVAQADLERVPALLKGQLAVSVKNAQGELLDATGLQLAGVLDALYTFDGALGVTFAGGVPTLRVWAPTARSVSLLLFDDSAPATQPQRVPMTAGAQGTWSVTGNGSWYGRYYLYEVEVFVRRENAVRVNRVTDPYSVSLSTNSLRSQIVDLKDPALQPTGWARLPKPPLAAPEDIVLYELHVRDFSINDTSVPAAERGTFKAFARGNRGTQHLSRLSQAGVTHVHLLPAFDIATINENRAERQEPAGDLSSYAPDSTQQQAAVNAVADLDGFNWGYDPFHYTVPEGSYSTQPDGPTRTLEFREMVQSLNTRGLNVVMDVVYNHTASAGQDARSVLDRIVPGYYHRLNADGNIETSTCCQNTATEHAMMEKLMVDSLVTWARDYKVDGFRFDLMGHHMRSNMLRVRAALDALTLERDGVDGRRIYLYGEGWNFGEVANNARGVNATQLNMPGTGIGTFSDRLRDAARGGGPFSGLQEQGFISGLFHTPNGTNQGSSQDQRGRLLHFMDLIRVGLAANLRDYAFTNNQGTRVTGAQVDYNGQPAGYALDPQEIITYVSAHDNETLFDAVQLKAPLETPMSERVRMHNMGMSLVALGQGIPFFHAGDELLRSKSLDRNSYNSGDWFNKLDWTYNSNNWGVGLPPARDNESNWPLFGSLLATPSLKPSPGDIQRALEHFEEMLRIRKSTPLLRLRTAADVQRQVTFENVGPGQIPGLIVMTVQGPPKLARERVVVLFNASNRAHVFSSSVHRGMALKLHPAHMQSTDSRVRQATFTSSNGTFLVPPRTTVVFVSDTTTTPFP